MSFFSYEGTFEGTDRSFLQTTPPDQTTQAMARFIALLFFALLFVCSPAKAGAAPDPCGVADSCKTCVATNGCGWCGETLECKKQPGMFGGGCKGMLKEMSSCTCLLYTSDAADE